MLSYSPDRSWPAVLNKQSLDHNVYIYYPNSKTVAKVVFSIDGKVYHTETSAAWDMAGTGTTGANAFKPSTLTSGAHTLLATVTTTSNVTLKTQATFSVPASVGKAVAVKATAKLLGVSASAKGTVTAKLDGATLKGHKYIRFSAAAGTVRAQYILDGKVIRSSQSGAGGRSSTAPLKTAALHKGKHHLLVRMVNKTGRVSVATAAFKIA
jgi:hypothetical protein